MLISCYLIILWIADKEKVGKLNSQIKIDESIWECKQNMNIGKERAALLTSVNESLCNDLNLEENIKINAQSQHKLAALLNNPNNIKINNVSESNKILIQQPENLIDNWSELQEKIFNCNKCNLCYGRSNVVIERGNREANWMFIGEGPGAEEDKYGTPFVGNSGKLLDKMIQAMKLSPESDVYICNVVKCRPPYNRNPEKDEINSCENYLFSQINLVKPKIIITLGRFASQTLLQSDLATIKLRGKVYKFKNIPVIVTYHPAYLLRNPDAKKDAWLDLQLAMKTAENL